MRRIFLVGYFGFDNFGDEILLQIFLKQFVRDQIIVLHTQQKVSEGVRYIKRFNPLALFKSVWSSDAMVFGGGGLLQDTSSAISLYYYLSLMVLARLFGRKICLAFQGLGPVARPGNKLIFRLVLAFCQPYLSVRDDNSLNFFHSLKTALPVEQYPDPSLRFFKSAKSMRNPDKILGVNLRETSVPLQHPDTLVTLLNQYCLEHDYTIRFFVLQPEQEADLVRKIAVKLQVGYEIKHITAINFDTEFVCDRLFAMRLHLLVLAYTFSIPILGIAYDPKVLSFLQSVHAPAVAMDLDGLSAELSKLLASTPELADSGYLASAIVSIERGFASLEKQL